MAIARKIITNTGYDTVAYLYADGHEHREPVHTVNTNRDALRNLGQDRPYAFHYEFNQYVSIGSPKNLIKIKSGVYYLNGIVYSKDKVARIADESLRERLLNQMDQCHMEYAVQCGEIWSLFDNVRDRTISVW